MYINRYCSIFSLHYSIRMKAKARLPHGQIPAGKQLLYCIFTHDSSYFQYCYCSKNKHSFKKLNLTIYIQFRYTFSWPKKRKIQFNNQKKRNVLLGQIHFFVFTNSSNLLQYSHRFGIFSLHLRFSPYFLYPFLI